jgi:hypothetical protein
VPTLVAQDRERLRGLWHQTIAQHADVWGSVADRYRPVRRRLVRDVGTGSGRHSHWAQRLGARVVSVDLGKSIDIARMNLLPSLLAASLATPPLAPSGREELPPGFRYSSGTKSCWLISDEIGAVAEVVPTAQ